MVRFVRCVKFVKCVRFERKRKSCLCLWVEMYHAYRLNLCQCLLPLRCDDEQLFVVLKICVDCPKGRYNALKQRTALTDCIDCGAGKYNDQFGQPAESSCRDCTSQTGCTVDTTDTCGTVTIAQNGQIDFTNSQTHCPPFT